MSQAEAIAWCHKLHLNKKGNPLFLPDLKSYGSQQESTQSLATFVQQAATTVVIRPTDHLQHLVEPELDFKMWNMSSNTYWAEEAKQ